MTWMKLCLEFAVCIIYNHVTKFFFFEAVYFQVATGPHCKRTDSRKQLSLNQKNEEAAIEKPLFVVQGCLEMSPVRCFKRKFVQRLAPLELLMNIKSEHYEKKIYIYSGSENKWPLFTLHTSRCI